MSSVGLQQVHQLKNVIQEATRITASSSSLIDVIITNHPILHDVNLAIDSFGLSDHHLVLTMRIYYP